MSASATSLAGRFEQVFPLPMTAATDINVVATHGRGSAPRRMGWRLISLNGEAGYLAGDELDTIQGFNGTFIAGAQGWANAAQLGFSFDASARPLWVWHKTTNAATALATPLGKKWALKVYAEW